MRTYLPGRLFSPNNIQVLAVNTSKYGTYKIPEFGKVYRQDLWDISAYVNNVFGIFATQFFQKL